MIKLVDINLIYEHPDNPRKDLGELEELADSIRESGILQNLTIVPRISSITKEPFEPSINSAVEFVQEYSVVIGHRRLAAAKLAGLTEVPCAITNMDHRTQVATMLLENMQRVDLTMYEQAQGFQMMLDLGETINDISSKTGFSERTVQRRIKLLELDQEKFKESADRGATLMEYMEISKIKDIDKRNEILDHVGTKEFKWELQRAINNQEKEELKQKLIEKAEGFATNIETVDREKVKTKYIGCLSYIKESLDREIEIEDGKEYLFQATQWSIDIWENIYGEVESEEERQRRELEEERRAREAELKARINEIKKRTQDLREDFIYSLTNTKLMKYIGEILILATEAGVSFNLWDEDFINIFKLEIEEDDFEPEEIEEEMIKRPALSLLKIIFNQELKGESYFNFRGEHSKHEALDKLYSILTEVGYEMSEEEKQLQDGSHKIFEELED